MNGLERGEHPVCRRSAFVSLQLVRQCRQLLPSKP
ncbi:MAG: hypothetical protein KatS3mg040_0144 [Candidatus Kapaibacterium sp.]|nr:MAG: hypothetical protein KatS3mg040_0144 [Candidatus Kapabacteria bacterium]